MAIVHMGYVGSCNVTSGSAGGAFFITGSSLNPVQDINVPEVVAGRASPYLYNWGKIETGGNITGPLFEGATTMASMWGWTYDRTTDLDHMTTDDIQVDICYYKGKGRRFENCSINSFEVTVTAGDVANFTIDFFGHGSSGSGVLTNPSEGSAGQLTRFVTWDVCSFVGGNFGGSTGGDDVQGFSFNLANNLQRVYAVGAPSGFAPFDVVAGIRRLTGTITVYAQNLPAMNDAKDDYGSSQTGSGGTSYTLTVSNLITKTFTAMTKRSQASAKTDTQTYTVDYQALAFDGLT